MTLQQAIDRATELHRAGRLDEAEKSYRHILSLQPNVPDVLQLLGVLIAQHGQPEAAIEWIRKAIALQPQAAVYHGNLGLALDQTGRTDEAAESFQTAIDLGSADPNIFTNFANVLRKKGNFDASIALSRRALALSPDFPEGHNNFGLALFESGQVDEAIAEYQTALHLRPQYAIAHNNLGNAIIKKRFFQQAISEFKAALVLRPDYPEALMNMGVALHAIGEMDPSIQCYNRALALWPDFYEALINLGQALCDTRQFDRAIDTFRKAVALRPGDQDAHFHLSGVLLQTGNFSEGWREYEWRLLKPQIGFQPARFPKPQWTGQNLGGKRIYLHWEQGAGDLIQICRLGAKLTEQGAYVILDCLPNLFRLLQTLKGVSRIVTEPPAPDEYDFHCYLLSLPLLLGLKVENIPAQVPYLYADPLLAEQWRARLSHLPQRKKIGITWAGNPKHTNDHNRSLPLSAFAPLAELHDVAFISLQKGEASRQPPPPGLQLIDHTADLSDYADTAALIENLDLVISADTSVAHLAGAMGKPVWTLLPFHGELRWLLDRTDSPWYPTMRLFRQTHPSDWTSPIRAVVDALRAENKS